MNNDNDTIQTFLKDNMEKYKLDNAIIILPFSNDSKTALLDKLDDTANYKIIHSKKKTSKHKTHLHLDISNNQIITTEKQITDYLGLVKKIIKSIQDCKNLCPLGYIQSQNSNVLSSLNHQLRTPLQGITSCASVLQTKNDDPTHKKILKHLLNSCLELNIYINDIMDFYLLKEKSMEMEYTSFKLNELVTEVNDFFLLDIEKAKIDYKFQLSIMLNKPIKTDYKRLKQIMRHLLSNSIHFSANETINLEIKKEDEKIVITLIDTGSGIKEAEREKVWLPFYQIEENWMTSQEGLGLGLTNTKMLCRELGGDIKFIDSPFSKGTALQFYIKDMCVVKKKKEKKMEINIEKIDYGYDENLYNNNNNNNENQIQNILIVEDHAMNAELIKLMLENKYKEIENKPNIDIITDSRKVIEKLKTKSSLQSPYDIIYLDLKMPNVSGFDILRIMNEDAELSDDYKNKIVLITALAQNKDTVILNENPLVSKIIYKPIRVGRF